MSTTQRFFVSPSYIQDNTVTFPADLAHQISRVLRLPVGACVLVLDNQGMSYEVKLEQITKRNVWGHIRHREIVLTEPVVELTLAVAFLKGKKWEWILQKGTELGVSCFIPFISQRSVVRSVSNIGNAKQERWQRIVREAAEQSGRGRVPTVEQPVTWETILHKARQQTTLALIASVDCSTTTHQHQLKNHLRSLTITQKPKIYILIGPEGGFNAEEINQAKNVGLQSITLGPRILRAETAAIAAATIIMYELDA